MLFYYDIDKETNTLWFQAESGKVLQMIGIESSYYDRYFQQTPELKNDFIQIDVSFILQNFQNEKKE